MIELEKDVKFGGPDAYLSITLLLRMHDCEVKERLCLLHQEQRKWKKNEKSIFY